MCAARPSVYARQTRQHYQQWSTARAINHYTTDALNPLSLYCSSSHSLIFFHCFLNSLTHSYFTLFSSLAVHLPSYLSSFRVSLRRRRRRVWRVERVQEKVDKVLKEGKVRREDKRKDFSTSFLRILPWNRSLRVRFLAVLRSGRKTQARFSSNVP